MREAAPSDSGRGRSRLDLSLVGAARSGRHALRLFHDREAHARLVTALFRDLAPALFRFLPALERAFDLGRAFHELVEVHRAELAANHPEITAFGHHSLLLFNRFGYSAA